MSLSWSNKKHMNKDKMNKKKYCDRYEVSIFIITYNSEYEKLIDTIDSILVQENVTFQIVITDDGSKINHFDKIERYFQECNFKDYKLTALNENKGTIANVKNGLLFASGRYVKGLAPGDKIYGKYALRKWLDIIETSSSKWSFCDVVCYHKENGIEVVDKTMRHPLNVKPYISNNVFSCRLNYLLWEDNINGACILSERDFMIKYLDKLYEKIKYAEDNLWRLCMYDGFVPIYCNKVFVKYEYGTGISTSGESKWRSIIKDEWNKSTKIIINEKPKDCAQIVLNGALSLENNFILRSLRALWWKWTKILIGKKAYTVSTFPESE